jgi:hypothetical protein
MQIQSDTNNYKQTQNVTPWDAQVLVKSRKFCYRKWQPQIQSTTKSFTVGNTVDYQSTCTVGYTSKLGHYIYLQGNLPN